MDLIEKLYEAAKTAVEVDWRNLFFVVPLALAMVGAGLFLLWLLWKGLNRSWTRLTSKEKPDKREPIDPVTGLVALVAFAISGEGMWQFFGHSMHLEGSPLRFGFLVLEMGAFACARRVRQNILQEKPAGIDWWIMWGITIVSGLMSASEATSTGERIFRLFIPIFAALMWELSLNGARNLVRERARERARERGERVRERAPWWHALIPQSALIKFGLLDVSGRSLDEAAREHIITRAALMSERYWALKDALTNRKWLALVSAPRMALTKWRARGALRNAVEQAGVGTDPGATNLFLAKLRVLRKFDDLFKISFENPWKFAEEENPQVSNHKQLPPPPPNTPRPKSKKSAKGGREKVPSEVRDYWVEVVAKTGEPPLTKDLKAKFGRSPATVRRWHQELRSVDPGALMSATQSGSPKALTSVNGSAQHGTP